VFLTFNFHNSRSFRPEAVDLWSQNDSLRSTKIKPATLKRPRTGEKYSTKPGCMGFVVKKKGKEKEYRYIYSFCGE